MKKKITKEMILGKIDDVVTDFVYYDRKEDFDLDVKQLNKAVKDGVVTIDEMVDKFRSSLEATFPNK